MPKLSFPSLLDSISEKYSLFLHTISHSKVILIYKIVAIYLFSMIGRSLSKVWAMVNPSPVPKDTHGSPTRVRPSWVRVVKVWRLLLLLHGNRRSMNDRIRVRVVGRIAHQIVAHLIGARKAEVGFVVAQSFFRRRHREVDRARTVFEVDPAVCRVAGRVHGPLLLLLKRWHWIVILLNHLYFAATVANGRTVFTKIHVRALHMRWRGWMPIAWRLPGIAAPSQVPIEHGVMPRIDPVDRLMLLHGLLLLVYVKSGWFIETAGTRTRERGWGCFCHPMTSTILILVVTLVSASVVLVGWQIPSSAQASTVVSSTVVNYKRKIEHFEIVIHFTEVHRFIIFRNCLTFFNLLVDNKNWNRDLLKHLVPSEFAFPHETLLTAEVSSISPKDRKQFYKNMSF